MTASTQRDGSTTPMLVIKLALAWAFVGGPLAWGVTETIKNAMKLFQ